MPKYTFLEDYFDAQIPEIRQLLLAIDHVLMTSDPKIKSSVLFNTAFYKIKNEIGYIGSIKKNKGVEFCFIRGFQINNPFLDSKNRKIVAGITFKNLTDFLEKEDVFREIIQEAILLDEHHERSAFYETFNAKRIKKQP
jgi:hypothetical protein